MPAEAVRPGRRGLLAAAGGLLAAALPRPARAGLPVPADGEILFDILRGGARIGHHRVSFAAPDGGRDGGLAVTSQVEIVIRFGPIPVYRYTHHVVEHWRREAQGGRLLAATAQTDDDGTRHFMRARATPGGLAVQGDEGGHYTAPPGTLIATHWNRAELDGPMVNPQGGKLLSPSVQVAAPAPVPLARGATVEARRYRLTGDARLDLWYDMHNEWAATRFVAKDDSVVLYRRV